MSVLEGVEAFASVSVPNLAVESNVSWWTGCVKSRVNTLKSPQKLSRPGLHR